MPYWKNQPMNIHDVKEISIIESDVSINIDLQKTLPNGFKFQTLGPTYLEEIYALLSNNYIEDNQHIIRLAYSKDFLYWYLKYIPPGFIVGLVYNKKLVGIVTASFIDMIILQKKIKIPYINFLCIQSKLRNLGLAPLLMDEIKSRLHKNKMTCAFFTGMKHISEPFCTTKDYAILINYPKLSEVGFIFDDLTPIPKLSDNPLHLIVASDIDYVVPKLNKFMEKFAARPFFTNESAHHFLLPKKNIVYTFVNKDSNNNITEMITVYKNYLYCIEKNKIITVAQLAFYYHETMDLTQLIIYLLDKLPSYNIDELIFKNTMDNTDINITKFSTYGQLHYFLYNRSVPKLEPNDLCFFPF